MINKLGNLENEQLFYAKREEQQELLQKVLAANESAADEEDVPGGLRGTGSSQIFRTSGTLGSLSGADEGLYMEINRKQKAGQSRHPLFKKFFYPGSKK